MSNKIINPSIASNLDFHSYKVPLEEDAYNSQKESMKCILVDNGNYDVYITSGTFQVMVNRIARSGSTRVDIYADSFPASGELPVTYHIWYISNDNESHAETIPCYASAIDPDDESTAYKLPTSSAVADYVEAHSGGGGGEKQWTLFDTITIDTSQGIVTSVAWGYPSRTDPRAASLRNQNAHELLLVLSESVTKSILKINDAGGGAQTAQQNQSGWFVYAKYLGGGSLVMPNNKFPGTIFTAAFNVNQYVTFGGGQSHDANVPMDDRINYISFLTSEAAGLNNGLVIKVYLR